MLIEPFQAIKDLGSVIASFQTMAKSEASKSTQESIREAEINLENKRKREALIKSIFNWTNFMILLFSILIIAGVYFYFKRRNAQYQPIDMTTTEV
jgi:hypothetical protein